VLVPDECSLALFSSDSFCPSGGLCGYSVSLTHGAGSSSSTWGQMVLSIDESLGFRRDFSRMVLVALFRYCFLSSLLVFRGYRIYSIVRFSFDDSYDEFCL